MLMNPNQLAVQSTHNSKETHVRQFKKRRMSRQFRGITVFVGTSTTMERL